MTKTERLKAHHLNLCRFLPGSWEKRFCRNLAWQAEHTPEQSLTPKQKLTLDLMVHRFRRQLAGRLPRELMLADPPLREDYGICDQPGTDPDKSGQTGTVSDLFDADPAPPHETYLDLPDFSPQRKLF